ncbi:deoxyribose-phosphate aldolase [Sphingobacteriales bacterium UPWRP_1]|nr:deoxyribose-phosphate aldolase [Sphingobacteriales bacterium TSM_CSM]PSJ76495.1 deoxyribose-phosphate aldolase [Sphingobacteriales bacterium UPWRP_1]
MQPVHFDAGLAALIDHTLLKPDATAPHIEQVCNEAVFYHFAAVCVPPVFVKQAAAALAGTGVQVATVIGFPLGYNHTGIKLAEIELAAAAGATEMDMVINLSALKNARFNYLENEIAAASQITHQAKGALLKVIIETALLTPPEIEQVCHICAAAGADFVKTSTGFNGAGATVAAVELMRKTLPPQVKIKASGGICTRQEALDMVKAGANRLGCSASVKIVTL